MFPIKRYLVTAPLIVVLTTGAFIGAALTLPKTYKSRAVVSIYTKYFQNPLVRDFVPETYDGSELRAQRESLIRLSLDEEFVDRMGETFHIYKTPADSPQRNAERQEMLKRFEIIGLNSTTYQISFSGTTADGTHEVMKETIDQLVQTLVNERRKTVQNLREAMGERIESLAIKLGKGSGPSASQARKELEGIHMQISALRKQFTDRHPQIERLKRRADHLNRLLEQKTAATGQGKEASEEGFNLDSVDVSQEIYQDLVKKYGYLNILMETEKDGASSYFAVVENPTYPTTAVFPNRVFFAVWGVLGGVLLAFFYILIDSYRLSLAANAEPSIVVPHPRRRRTDLEAQAVH